MAKLSGSVVPLITFVNPYSTTPGGRVFNLSSSIVIQQSMTNPMQGIDGESFSGPGGSTPFSPSTVSFSVTPLAVLCTAASSKILLPVKVAETLSFATKEFTLSMWVSGSTYARTVQSLSSSCILQSSGSNGIQFSVGRFDTQVSPTKCHILLTTSTSSAGPVPLNVVASTHNTAGKSAAQCGGSGVGTSYRGRYFALQRPPVGQEISNPFDATSPTWHHIVYVQKAALSPEQLVYQASLGASTSPFLNLSSNGQEGRCEVWLDGKLTYNTPAFGPFAQGSSPYFYEDGLDGLNNSSATRLGNSDVLNKTIRQTNPGAFLSGSSTNQDAIAQLTIWRRALDFDEIVSIYDGNVSGVYATPITSFSSAPKRLIAQTTSFGNNSSSDNSSETSYFDTTPHELLVKQETYQQNHYYDKMTENIGSVVIGDGTTAKISNKVDSFTESDDYTNPTRDDEFVIPSGSSIIRIGLPNTDPNTVAARNYNQLSPGDPGFQPFVGAVGVDSTAQFVGTGFLYYSPVLKKWIEKRADGATSLSSDNNYLVDNKNAVNFIMQVSASFNTSVFPSVDSPVKANSILSQFAWSPQFGYFVNHVEHLAQAGYQRIGWPTSFFGAPNTPKYHAYDQETIKLSQYINRPFVLKRIELRIPVRSERKFGVNPDNNTLGPAPQSWEYQVTNKKDVDNYVFFVYRQRRVSRDKDSYEDRNTSKRYLIASASICYYNSGSFGGSWTDGFYNQLTWSTNSGSELFNALAHPTSSVDYFGQSLTRISGSNCVLHNPQYSKDWGLQRYFNAASSVGSTVLSDTQFLNLSMLPTVVPQASAAPSLIPVTGAFSPRPFAEREGVGPPPVTAAGAYVITGTKANRNAGIIAPCLTLVSNMWLGGSRPPQLAAYQNYDPYDTVVTASSAGVLPQFGSVDTRLQFSPSFVFEAFVGKDSLSNGLLGSVSTKIARGALQCHGLSLAPAAESSPAYSASNPGPLDTSEMIYQQSMNPQSVNSPLPVGKKETLKFHGRRTASINPDSFTTENNGQYMSYFGWRFISSFVKSDFDAQQSYSPEILNPEDELVIGLDAGTFGPPDLDSDDLVGDNRLPSTHLPAGLGSAGNRRLFKNTFLKEEYRKTLTDSRLRILTGEAEIILIGDYLQDELPIIVKNQELVGNNVSSFYGEKFISDQSFLFNAELLSGSLFTRVYSGTEGPQGLIDGNATPNSARRFVLDAGARRAN